MVCGGETFSYRSVCWRCLRREEEKDLEEVKAELER